MDSGKPNSPHSHKRLRVSEHLMGNPTYSLGDAAKSQPSDIVAQFAARAGRVQALQQDLDSVKRQAQQQATTLVQVKTELSSLRDENSRLCALSRAEIHQAQFARDKASTQLQTEIRRVAMLEAQLAAQSTVRMQSTADQTPDSTQTPPPGSSTEGRLNAKIDRLKMKVQQQEAEAADAAERHRCDTQLAADIASASEAHTRDLQGHLNKTLQDLSAAEEAAAAARLEAVTVQQEAASAAAKYTASCGSESVVMELASARSELSRMEIEVAEARKLREYVTNAEVLREKLRSAEVRVKHAEAQAEAASASQIASSDAGHTADKQASFYLGALGVKTPEEVLLKVQQMQRDATAQSDRLAQATASLNSIKGQLALADERLNEQQATAAQTEKALTDAIASTGRLNKQLDLLQQQRDSLKRILKSYQADSTSGAAANDRTELAAEQLAILEQTVETLLQEAKETEAALVTEAATQAELRAAAMETEVRATAAETAADQLGCQVAELQTRLGRGEFNTETTRVLHLVRNPEAEQQREIAAARIVAVEEENTALRSELRKMEIRQQQQQQQPFQVGSTNTEALGIEAAMANSEIAISKRKIADLEKGMKRLKETFNSSITSFREACYFLFGYSIEMACKPTSTAHSKPAPATFTLTATGGDARTQLRFASQSNSGGLRLIPSPYTEKLKQEVATYIDRFCSIPAFLANLTMENFQKNMQQ